MKLKFLATNGPLVKYEIDGEKITITKDGGSDQLDLSEFETGDKYEGCSLSCLSRGKRVVRNVERDSNGELWVTLTQECGKGHWRESDWIDSEDFDPYKTYIREISAEEAGVGKWVR